jgi:hypothetical protein
VPRNGSGAFNLVSGNPVVPSTVVSSTWANNTLNDIASGLTQSLSSDGQTTPVANLPMATFRHTNVGNAVARTDYAAAGQVQDGSLQWLTSVAGTNTITASITPSPTVYAAGQTFHFTAAATNTGAVTLNINGLGAKSVTKQGTVALAAGDIASAAVVTVVYDGTQFQLQSTARGQYIGTQVFTSSGTYTPTVGTRIAIVEVIGGGGAGGGAAATAAGQFSIGGGGGAGGYARGLISNPVSGAVTVGAGGTGVSGGNGNNGGASGYQGLITVGGGTGAAASIATTAPSANGGAGGGVTIAGSQINANGQSGCTGWAYTGSLQGVTGAGASSMFGAGGADNGNGNTSGSNGSGAGSGGSGAFNLASQAARSGGNGAGGIILVHEYV